MSREDSALLYDTLLSEDKRDDYLRQEGRMTSVGNFAEAAGGLIGLIYCVSIFWPIIAMVKDLATAGT